MTFDVVQQGDATVLGYCPMGCGQTLFLASGGYITCSYAHCPNRTAVADILDDGETSHIVKIEESSFFLKHPLRERIADDLFGCAFHERLSALDGPPRAPGTYRVTDGWGWTLKEGGEE